MNLKPKVHLKACHKSRSIGHVLSAFAARCAIYKSPKTSLLWLDSKRENRMNFLERKSVPWAVNTHAQTRISKADERSQNTPPSAFLINASVIASEFQAVGRLTFLHLIPVGSVFAQKWLIWPSSCSCSRSTMRGKAGGGVCLALCIAHSWAALITSRSRWSSFNPLKGRTGTAKKQ